MKFNTKLLHEGVRREREFGATLSPIYQSSAFDQPSAEDLEKIFSGKSGGYCYTRVGNPTVTEFENRITKLEGGAVSTACASGLAAISNALLNILKTGDEIISAAGLYGGTIDLFEEFEAFGIKTVWVDANDIETVRSKITENTRVIFAETIGNPKLDVTDIDALSALAHENGIPLIIDNTVATPFIVRPIEHGADIVVNSSSKYINGSANSISGVITDAGKFKWDIERYPNLAPYKKFGPFAYTSKLKNGLWRNTGACLAPQNAFLNMIGLETLGIRMERHSNNALELARFLDSYEGITVNYPGLKSSPWHDIAAGLNDKYFGGIVTVRVGSKENAFKLINSLKIAYKLSNIGDTKTLVVHPSSTVAAHSTDKQKEEAGVFEDLVRISVGIEDIEDLKEDFEKALAEIGFTRS